MAATFLRVEILLQLASARQSYAQHGKTLLCSSLGLGWCHDLLEIDCAGEDASVMLSSIVGAIQDAPLRRGLGADGTHV